MINQKTIIENLPYRVYKKIKDDLYDYYKALDYPLDEINDIWVHAQKLTLWEVSDILDISRYSI